MVPILPVGFLELIERVMKGSPFSGRKVPRRTSDVWDYFSYFVFLDHNRLNAEVAYIYDVLDKARLLDMTRVLKLRTNWSKAVRDYLAKSSKGLSPRKQSAISSLLRNVLDAERCILEGANYFTTRSVSPSYLISRTRTVKDANDLVYEWSWPDYATNPNHIWRFGLTKSFLFLNDMGLAVDHCPPSWQVLKFVEEDLGKNVSPLLYQDEPPAVTWTNAYIAIGEVRQVARGAASRIKGVTTADVGHGLWYWKSAQNLLTFSRGGLRRRLTPAKLIDFLERRRSSLQAFGSEMADIDSVDPLAAELKRFVQSNP